MRNHCVRPVLASASISLHTRDAMPSLPRARSRLPLALLLFAVGATSCAPGDTPPAVPSQAERGAALFTQETFQGNGRVCSTCHILEAFGSITPEMIQARYAQDPGDPLFRVIDSDDGVGTSYARLLEHATVRVKIQSQVHQPSGLSVRRCDAPEESEIVLNRGNPSVFNSALEDMLMSDAREGTDLDTQALNAVLSHAEPRRTPTAEELAAIRFFQETLFSHAALEDFAAGGAEPVLPEPRTEAERRGRAFFDADRQCGICHSGPLLNQTSDRHTDVIGSRVETATVGNEPENPNPKYEWCFVDPETNRIVEGPKGETRVFPFPAADPGMALLAGGQWETTVAGEEEFVSNLELAMLVGPIFKIPTLWGTPDTAPYFHDNSAKTLAQAVEQYNFMFRQIPGFAGPAGCDMTREDCLNPQDVADIVAYMQLLSFQRTEVAAGS